MYDFVAYLMLMGAVSGASSLPFWATANQYGLMPESSGALALLGASTSFDDSKTFQWKWGASLAASTSADGSGNLGMNPIVDEAYASMRLQDIPLILDLGMKHQPLDFLAGGETLRNGGNSLGSLSTTGGHLMWTGNARTLPGYALHLEPVAVPWCKERLWVYGTFGDYLPLDKRYCKGSLIHSTKVFVRYDFAGHFKFHAGLDHVAVWGWDNNLSQKTFGNYLRMITGRPAGSDGMMIDRLNVIGDQEGSELFGLEYESDRYRAVIQHDIPYNDASGMAFMNFPDGVNTLFLGWKDKNRWVSDIMYEYAYTVYQSGPIRMESFDEEGNSTTPEGICTTGNDDYFNNYAYKDGWVYYGRTIGYPLFYPAEQSAEGYTLGVRNNRVIAHHFALSGKLFKKAPYKLMLTSSRNYGRYEEPYAGQSAWQKPWGTVKETPLYQFSSALTGEIPIRSRRRGPSLHVLWGIYADRGEVLDDAFGCTFGIRYSLY